MKLSIVCHVRVSAQLMRRAPTIKSFSASAKALEQLLWPDGGKTRVILPKLLAVEQAFFKQRLTLSLYCSAAVHNEHRYASGKCVFLPSDLSSPCVQPQWTGSSHWQLRGLWTSRIPLGPRSAASSPQWTCEPRSSETPSLPLLTSEKRGRTSQCQV